MVAAKADLEASNNCVGEQKKQLSSEKD